MCTLDQPGSLPGAKPRGVGHRHLGLAKRSDPVFSAQQERHSFSVCSAESIFLDTESDELRGECSAPALKNPLLGPWSWSVVDSERPTRTGDIRSTFCRRLVLPGRQPALHPFSGASRWREEPSRELPQSCT